jgi:hypothetical protein
MAWGLRVKTQAMLMIVSFIGADVLQEIKCEDWIQKRELSARDTAELRCAQGLFIY